MSNPLEEFRDRERVRLVEADLALTNEFVRGVIATGTAVRGFAVTIWLALMGVALQQSMPSLGVLSSGIAACFWLIDGYYGWLYGEASLHARACETVLSEYFDAVSRAEDDPSVIDRLHASLRVHRFGLFLGFRSDYRPRQWWSARPTFVYRTLYPALIGVALGVAVLFWVGVLHTHDASLLPGHLHRHR